MLAVVEGLARALAAASDPQGAVTRYRRLLALEPEREGWHRSLMRVYAGAGERALALRQFHACRTVLRREQGIEPGPETQSLYLELLRDDAGGVPAQAVTLT
jgi:DNA-binding SARP family transcriptional activator